MKSTVWISLFVLLFGIILIGYVPKQSDFTIILLGFSFAFGGYSFLLLSIKDLAPSKLLIWGALLIPAVLVLSIPNLSDDVYRFVWDGLCTTSGISPYEFTPNNMPSNLFGEQRDFLIGKLNSPDYYSIYPTISQLFFALIVKITSDFYLQVIGLKAIYLLLHIIGGFSIYAVFMKNQLDIKALALYYYNPLVIVEGIGNLHAEINMVSFLFIALYFWYFKKHWLSAFMYSCAINVKLIPIFFLGYFLVRFKDKKTIFYLGKVVLFSVILFIPVIYGLVTGGFLESVDLYFRKFEFNASIYYLLREIGMLITGYNLIAYIGPLLFFLFVFMAFYRWLQGKKQVGLQHFIKTNEWVFFLYLLCSTIIHPWYIILLIGMNVFLNRSYILVWSFLITLTYINYSYNPYFENMWIVIAEYGIVLTLAFYEIGKERRLILKQSS